ncbi:hypothetical protein AB7942_16140 [Neobacillus sp. BF23-41]|uniref:hypothetical protein n=1 Tax=Neobacillus sp. BF23-41 TaxID=3240280 RepID=UPI0034E42273
MVMKEGYIFEQGMEPIWFIEKEEQSIEMSKIALVLWDAELSISSKPKKIKSGKRCLLT